MASPFAREGYIDHRLYDHTSILRFIEWRFLGAPPEGPRGKNWYLTSRDRHALNIGQSLRPSGPKPEIELDAMPQVPVTSGPCEVVEADAYLEKSPFEQHFEAGYFERAGYKIDFRPLPYPTDD
jgi:phospholipase C